ncbi:MAG: hypothetical protein P0Y65_15260 [Candidatus Devosia phytovorans]|uniref:Yip1 domain-containing protein n=1 Tax=Candidatus Devosia phytovorans TaxID=3121372 RepID=A0AAJ5VTX8_9HYPH|nr:hypothetical protein [Devosia sp.]WEK03542.1 MAG: hypothetical protein P0Y65_15260 [Devosia sp.]
MRIWRLASEAYAGWLMILRGEAGWRERFSLNAAGLLSGLVIFFFAAFLAIALGSIVLAMPDVFGVLDLLLVHAIWVLAFWATIKATKMALKDEVATLDLLVPGIYLLVGYLVVGSVLNLILAPLVQLLTLLLAWPIYRLGRMATEWNKGITAAFAAATVLLLVAVPQALYMLSSVPV